MSTTLQQEHQILRLIKQRRKQLQDDREALRKPMSYQMNKLN